MGEVSGERSAFLPGQIDHGNWGRLFTDADLWRPVVRRICRRTGLAEGRKIEAGFPGSCAVFIVDRAIVVKIYPPVFAADFARETAVYETIQDRLPHIPRVLARGIYHDRIDWPYLALSFCPGDPIRVLAHLLGEQDKIEIGRELGRLIRRLHDGPIPQSMNRSWDHWRQFLLANRERTLAFLREERPFGDSVIDEIEAFLVGTENIWLAERPLCLINADLTQDHLLLLEEDGAWRISAVIDWADAEVGLPEYEWVALWYGLCQQDRHLFRAIISTYDVRQQLDEAFWQRLLAYTFLHSFGGPIVMYSLDEHGRPEVQTLADLGAIFLPDVPRYAEFAKKFDEQGA